MDQERLFKKIIIPFCVVGLTFVNAYWIFHYKIYWAIIEYLIAMAFLLLGYKFGWSDSSDLEGHKKVSVLRKGSRRMKIAYAVSLSFVLIGFLILLYAKDLFFRLALGTFFIYAGIAQIRHYKKVAT